MTARPISKEDIMPLLSGTDITGLLNPSIIRTMLGGPIATKVGSNTLINFDGSFDVPSIVSVGLSDAVLDSDELVVVRNSGTNTETALVCTMQVFFDYIAARILSGS